jgi:hypothetical protein
LKGLLFYVFLEKYDDLVDKLPTLVTLRFFQL